MQITQISMLQKKYKSELIDIINPFSGIYTLKFKSLNGIYKYHPGQFLHIAIDPDYDGSGQWPESRCFSMQSNPNEETIKITYSVKGKFTHQMEQNLKVGSEVWLKLPYGDLFTQPHNKENTVFIAGGTGITPYLSLFTHVSFNQYTNPKIYLGFRSRKHNIYLEELEIMQAIRNIFLKSNNSFSIELVKSYNEDIDGPLNIQNIFNENTTLNDYFISGPPSMIKTFMQTLIKNGIPQNHILTDNWE